MGLRWQIGQRTEWVFCEAIKSLREEGEGLVIESIIKRAWTRRRCIMMMGMSFGCLLLVACGGGNGEKVSYASDVRPILQMKCSPCHTTDAQGGVNHASVYGDTQVDSAVCSGKVFDCILQRVEAGEMPLNAGCSGNPAQDSGNSACLTASELQILRDWVADGAVE